MDRFRRLVLSSTQEGNTMTGLVVTPPDPLTLGQITVLVPPEGGPDVLTVSRMDGTREGFRVSVGEMGAGKRGGQFSVATPGKYQISWSRFHETVSVEEYKVLPFQIEFLLLAIPALLGTLCLAWWARNRRGKGHA